MVIELWEGFSKRYNSTKIPEGAGSVKNVRLKEDTSTDSPVFILNDTNTDYSYIKAFESYYFVSQVVVLTNTQIEIHCEKDLLATYKNEILATSAYVLFHTHTNTQLSDKRLGVNTTRSLQASQGTFSRLGISTVSQAMAVVSVQGEDSVGSYILSQEDARNLLNNLSNFIDNQPKPDIPEIEGITDVVNAVIATVKGLIYTGQALFYAIKQLMTTGSASEKIKNAIILPLQGSAEWGVREEIHLGYYDTQIYGYRITNRILSDSCTMDIPWQATDWRRNAPYHELYLYIPYVGVVSLSPSDLVGEESITVWMVLDIMTGDAVFHVRSGVNHHIAQYNTNLGASFAIGTSNINPSNAITTVVSGVSAIAGAVATGNPLGATAGIYGLLNDLGSQGATIGSNSGVASYGLTKNCVLYSIYHNTVAEPSSVNATIGTPTNKVMSLSGITGYVQTASISVDCDAESPEKSKLNSMIDSGVYIE